MIRPDMTDKKTQRLICLESRNRLTLQEREDYSAAICERLLPYMEGKRILSYFPIGSEVDVSMINERFTVAYPVIAKGRRMDSRLPKENRFTVNTYGIHEPDPEYSTIVDPADIDVVIVPCVGFDEKKNRLGHGGGYYDRYLKKTNALRICVAFEAQKLDQVIADENDIAMDLIITEKGVY